MNSNTHRSPAPSFLILVTAVTAVTGLMAVAGAGPANAMDVGGANEVVNAVGINSTSLGRINRKLEQKIAECMKTEGFTYTVEGGNVPADAVDGGASNRQAFVKKYGYGLSTTVDATKKPVTGVNEAYVAKLSKSEQKSYQLALLGFDPTANADPNAQFTPKSCVGKAFAILGDPTSVQSLITKLNGLTTRANANAEVVKALRSWSSCMKTAGFTYAKDTDVEADITKRLVKVYPVGSSTTFDSAGLIKLQKLERDTARADWDCSKKHLAVRDKVLSQLNRTFLADNQAEVNSVGSVIKGK